MLYFLWLDYDQQPINKNRKGDVMVELFRRLLDMWDSFFGWPKPAESDHSPGNKPQKTSGHNPEEITIILPSKEYENLLFQKLREYIGSSESCSKMWKERIAGYTEDYSDPPHWNDSHEEWWTKTYGKYLDRAQRQTTIEFMILLELLKNKRIDLKKFAEDLKDKLHLFDMNIYRDACTIIQGYYDEVVRSNTKTEKS